MRVAPIIAVLAILLCGQAAAQTATATLELPPVNLVGISPLLGSAVDPNMFPAEINILNSGDLTHGGTTAVYR